MDRKLWDNIEGICSIYSFPVLPCAYCDNRASLSLDISSVNYRLIGRVLTNRKHHPDKDKFKLETDSSIPFLHKSINFLSNVIEESTHHLAKVTCFLVCDDCKKSVSASGTGIASLNERTRKYALSEVKVEYFSPYVPIFHIASSVPEVVNGELMQAFSHYLTDKSSAGIKVRRVLEAICNEFGYCGSSLHRRIELFEKEHPQYQGFLTSLKLLGNEAAHGSKVSKADLLDAFEILSVVQNVFEPNVNHLRAKTLATSIGQKYQR